MNPLRQMSFPPWLSYKHTYKERLSIECFCQKKEPLAEFTSCIWFLKNKTPGTWFHSESGMTFSQTTLSQLCWCKESPLNSSTEVTKQDWPWVCTVLRSVSKSFHPERMRRREVWALSYSQPYTTEETCLIREHYQNGIFSNKSDHLKTTHQACMLCSP